MSKTLSVPWEGASGRANLKWLFRDLAWQGSVAPILFAEAPAWAELKGERAGSG